MFDSVCRGNCRWNWWKVTLEIRHETVVRLYIATSHQHGNSKMKIASNSSSKRFHVVDVSFMSGLPVTEGQSSFADWTQQTRITATMSKKQQFRGNRNHMSDNLNISEFPAVFQTSMSGWNWVRFSEQMSGLVWNLGLFNFNNKNPGKQVILVINEYNCPETQLPC